jgi:hypothetical protein
MTDMLVRLYKLPELKQALTDLELYGISLRRAMAFERNHVLEWVHANFSEQWAAECETAFGSQPIDCYIALENNHICGFCALDCTFLNFIGPIGVSARCRNKGVGRALLLCACTALRSKGYVYAVIGDVGSPVFFSKAVGAEVITGSSPGAYRSRLR